jgi:hypothetical protein
MSELHLEPAPDPSEPVACSCTAVPAAEGVPFDTLAVAAWLRRYLDSGQEVCVHRDGEVSFAAAPGEERMVVRVVRR